MIQKQGKNKNFKRLKNANRKFIFTEYGFINLYNGMVLSHNKYIK